MNGIKRNEMQKFRDLERERERKCKDLKKKRMILKGIKVEIQKERKRERNNPVTRNRIIERLVESY